VKKSAISLVLWARLATSLASAQGQAPCTKELGNAFLRPCQQWGKGVENQRKADLGNGTYLNPSYNHNVAYGFMSLGRAIHASGKDKVRFANLVYRALP